MKVGEYARTKWGCIAKFEGINEGFYEFDNIIMDESSAVREELLVNIVEKSSPNIIDLIEVGDVIKLEYNGNEYICDVYEYKGKANCLVVYCENTIIPVKTTDESVELKSIVTKEAFERMEYRIGE